VAVLSADKSLLGLLANTRVSLFRLSDSGDILEHTADAVRLKLGVDPHQVTDLLAIAGDSSLGIPGAEGIGEKGAAELLREYGSVDGLLSAVADGTIKKHSFTKAFSDPILRAKFELSRNLVRLRLEATFEKMTIAAPVTEPSVLPPEDLDIDPRVYKLLKESGIDDSYIAQMGCRYATASEVAEVSGYPQDKLCQDGAVAIPYPGVRTLDGSPYFSYRQLDGLPKYLGPRGQSTEIYVPINYDKNKGSFALVITEGEKKAALLDSIGIPALGIKGVSVWFDESSRAAQNERGEPLNEKTLPHKLLLREALDAEFVIILGDSDCHFNPLSLHGLKTLGQSLAYHIQLNHKGKSAEPDWNPLKSTRNIPVSVALCNSRWENVQIETSEGKDDECHADPVKTGADDLFLRLLAAEAEQSAAHLTQFNADNHSHDRVKAIHAMRELLMALGIAGLGATNYDLGLMIASKTRHELAYRPKSWMHYDPAKGIWSESSSDEQLAAPPILSAMYESAANALYRDISLAAGDLLHVPTKRLLKSEPQVYTWLSAARVAAKGTSASADMLKTTKDMKDILSQSKHMVSVPMEYWDAADDMFAAANGIIDLRDGRVCPHSPERLLTTGSTIIHDPLAECPLWLKFLEEVQPKLEVRLYLQALMGYCLTGRINMQQVYIFKGTGGNGKGLFISVMRHVFGSYGVVASKTLVLRQHNATSHPTNLAALRGKHWATLSELPNAGELDTSVLKQLTGGDKVTARKMNQDFGDFDMKASITIDTNDIPYISEASPAMRRRLVMIDWPVSFEGREDRWLEDKLKAEASGILNWLLDGARLYYAKALYNQPKAVIEATAKLWASIDCIGQWIGEECIVDKDIHSDGKFLCSSFARWSEENRIPVIGSRSFYSKLRLAKYVSDQSHGKTLFTGLRLKTEAEKDEDPIPRKPVASDTKTSGSPGGNAYTDATPSTAAAVPAKKFRRVQ
jgi:P4 family phage/plasmid primase-like protien